MEKKYKRVLSIQDLSCFGQCSLTVALPVLSACGLETVILPSAVLSTHTTGFDGYTFRDLTEDMPAIAGHWRKEGIRFDAVYTGYIGNARQFDMIRRIFSELLLPRGKKIVDPAMADDGELYPDFDENFVNSMRSLVAESDIVLPNITEAAFLTGADYRTEYDREYITGLTDGLHRIGAKTAILTGVSFEPEMTGIMISSPEGSRYYAHEKLPRGSFGTGDVFASAFVGAYLSGKSEYDAARIAADYALACLRNTADDPEHWYGVKFEPLLGDLIREVRQPD